MNKYCLIINCIGGVGKYIGLSDGGLSDNVCVCVCVCGCDLEDTEKGEVAQGFLICVR